MAAKWAGQRGWLVFADHRLYFAKSRSTKTLAAPILFTATKRNNWVPRSLTNFSGFLACLRSFNELESSVSSRAPKSRVATFSFSSSVTSGSARGTQYANGACSKGLMSLCSSSPKTDNTFRDASACRVLGQVEKGPNQLRNGPHSLSSWSSRQRPATACRTGEEELHNSKRRLVLSPMGRCRHV